MDWAIKCHRKNCLEKTWAINIVDLIENHLDNNGWILCNCGSTGYIERSFELQEVGKIWEPYLRGIITLGAKDDTYQPFLFVVSYEPNEDCNDVWFSYYKDLRSSGGRLKLGYGPGGPPVLSNVAIKHLLKKLLSFGYFSKADIKEILTYK